MAASALILFAHGARDPRWAAPFNRLRDIVQATRPDIAVAVAFLELMTPGLPEVAQDMAAKGCESITIVPVFLGQGGHVLRDLPELVTQLRDTHPAIRIDVAQAVGENADVLNAIAAYCLQSMAQTSSAGV